MPLQRRNIAELRLAVPQSDVGHTLDELLGPPGGRPGELREPAPLPASAGLREAARRAGLSTSMALTLTAERALVCEDLAGEMTALSAYLDEQAVTARAQLEVSAAAAEYVRLLLAALNRRLPPSRDEEAVVVVPSRLADRLRAAVSLDVHPDGLDSALAWELAAVRAGRTMTEWALLEALRYPFAAERQSCAAASAAR